MIEVPAPQAVEAPTKPPPRACGSPTRTRNGESESRRRAPRPGNYAYRLRGEEVVVADNRRTYDLPPTMTMTTTPATTLADGRLCFRVQRRIRRALVETATFAGDGSGMYATQLNMDSETESISVRPRPALQVLGSEQLEWSGSFTGETRGHYVGRILGRRTLRVGGGPVRAIGVSVDSSFAGEFTATQRFEQWVALDRYLIVRERRTERRQVGNDRFILRYEAHLQSLDPEGK